MELNKVKVVALSIIVTIICIALTITSFIMDGPATVYYVVINLVYLIVWIFTTIFAIRTNSKKIKIYSIVFWSLTLLCFIVNAYVNITKNSADWIIPLVIVFMTQWQGVGFFVHNYVHQDIIVSLISLTMLTISTISLIKNRHSKLS